ncbi:Bug family tripartite tricarboxylate transporter substrate binding protein [Enterovirga rhinocerotis]|uniref:Tripartite-type tricarboxylate transporter receptor subunit TctC n=1 Tax=Enterovirga rhinocerotis TaxID=1339210 RepID=A0A4R7CC14_9HYPH|nr:tripartite tricarboxylate transporter substrate binding protein [Enterovirga rhinocerotis]TDR94995.1 tripartite-type tricarboxylate transporter receptor subunit TctC [Enterovirga rhinocerotis]
MRVLGVLLAGGLAAIQSFAAQADAYPSRTITMIVPFAAGSGTDAVARVIAQELGPALKGNVVVENKAGASGAIAATFVARAQPDGYTLFMTTNTSHSANPSLLKSINYDPVKDFTPIVRGGNLPFMLVVDPKLPVKSVQELVAYAKANPGKLTYAYGNSTGIVAGETFKRATGIDVLKVPYKSTPPAITDVVGGRVSFMFIDLTSGMAMVKSGGLRPLAVTTAERSAILPDIPAMTEAGVPGFDITSWNGIFAPANLPKDITARLNEALKAIIAKPEVKARLAEMGFDAFSSTPEELDAFVKSELVKWTKLIKEAGIEPE